MKHTATLDASFWVNAQRVGLLPHVQARYALHYAPAVAEVGELSEGSAGVEVGHRPSLRVALYRCGRLIECLVGEIPLRGGRGGT